MVGTGAWGDKGGLHNKKPLLKGGGRASKQNLPRRSRSKHEKMNRRKSSPQGSAEIGFIPNLAKQTEIGKVRRRAHS